MVAELLAVGLRGRQPGGSGFRAGTTVTRRGIRWGLALCAGMLSPGMLGLGMLGPSPALGQTVGLTPLAALHAALHLTPEQEVGWQAYRAQASAPTVAQGRRRAAAQMFPTLTAPQRMDLVEAEMRQELLDLRAQSAALKAFYAILSPEQQRIFDTRTLPPPQPQPPTQ